MSLVLGLISVLLIVSTLACLWQARAFSRAEASWRERYDRLDAEWRERERLLVDRLLKMAKVEPIASRVEVENVIKFPDPELPPLSPEAQLLREDVIKEEIEQMRPDLATLQSWQIRELHPTVWREFERRYEERHTPLRA